MPTPELHTSRLYLRPWRINDVDTIHSILIGPAVRRYLCDDLIFPRERVVEFAERSLSLSAEHSIGYWAIYLTSERHMMIGFCGLTFIDDTQDVELIYALLPAFWGHGLATEASRAVLDYAWSATDFKRIFARTDPPNRKSIDVMIRLGMQPHEEASLVSYAATRPPV